MRILCCLLLMLTRVTFGTSQTIKSPDEFLGRSLGSDFTNHHDVVAYFRYIAQVSNKVKLVQYGTTNEGRPLIAAFIGTSQNIAHLEEIRQNNLSLAGFGTGTRMGSTPVIVWLSYNVHGNEAVSTEASLKTFFELVSGKNPKADAWLKNTVVVIDPCMNPDGRERYVSFYRSARGQAPDPYPMSREHLEPWPGGRTNHYYFDLNRDWAWQTQRESRERLALYNQWLPEIHVDFHEQGISQPYYFAPAAEPLHENITRWQKDFQQVIGKNNAKYFDERGWMYFTRERFDLLYPSYGDTYPIYNGSIGMTYEQGGGGRAGLAVVNVGQDTLTLEKRIEHHYVSAMSTLEIASAYSAKILVEFRSYFSTSANNPPGRFKTYVIKGDNPEKLKELAGMLQRNKISFGYGSSKKSARGISYVTGRPERFSIGNNDMVINAYQPKSVLLKVLLEPVTYVSDSNTYDITAWSLPYAFGLNAYACSQSYQPLNKAPQESPPIAYSASTTPVAFAVNWNSVADARFLAALLKRNVKVRFTETPFDSKGEHFNAGSLIIARAGNEGLGSRFSQEILDLAASSGLSLQPIGSAFVDKGSDLGSPRIRYIKKPRVGVFMGDDVSPQSFGEIWFFFEQILNYPLSVLRTQDLERLNLNDFDTLIFPDGSYDDPGDEKILNWVKSGGKVVAISGALNLFANRKGFALKTKEGEKKDQQADPYADLKPYDTREREGLKSAIPGAIFKVNLDNSHPLAFGFPNYYFTLKLDDQIYSFLDSGWNVGVLKRNNYVTGFAGARAKKKLVDGLIFGVENIGAGSVVYLTDDPLFRSFWENGKLLFSNAVFLVGQ